MLYRNSAETRNKYIIALKRNTNSVAPTQIQYIAKRTTLLQHTQIHVQRLSGFQFLRLRAQRRCIYAQRCCACSIAVHIAVRTMLRTRLSNVFKHNAKHQSQKQAASRFSFSTSVKPIKVTNIQTKQVKQTNINQHQQNKRQKCKPTQQPKPHAWSCFGHGMCYRACSG